MSWRDYKFTVDPAKKGIRQVLGELEADVMEILWEEGEASVREVHRRLERRRGIAYTTVMTVMSRLADKNVLSKHRRGKAYIYSPTCSREEFTQSFVAKVLSGLMRDFAAPAVSEFLETARSDPEAMRELERLLEKRRQGDGGDSEE